MSEVISLAEKKSEREEQRMIYRCTECNSYSFKIISCKKGDWLSCANCENWIQEFELTRTRDDL